MTKTPIIMLVDDAPIPEVAMARASEHHRRTSEFVRLCNGGHIRVLQAEEPDFITVEIEGEQLSDRRDSFPSTLLMAKLQLAVKAGRSNRKTFTADYHIATARSADTVWQDEAWANEDAVALGYHNATKQTRAQRRAKPVTATVKRANEPAMKGVRP